MTVRSAMASEGWNLINVWRSLRSGRIRSRPLSVNVLVTDRCNSRCVTCDIWKNGVAGKDPFGVDFYRRVAGELADMGTRRVAIGGGEPLLRRDLEEIVAAFARTGFDVQLTTHGLLADEKRTTSLWKAGLGCLTFSLDAHTREKYLEIRGVDWFDAVVKNFTKAVQACPKGKAVETNTVLCAQNLSTAVATLEFALDLGVSGLNVSPVVTHAENNLLKAEKPGLLPAPEEIEGVVAGILKLKRRTGRVRPSDAYLRGIPAHFREPSRMWFPCYAGYLSLDIYANGDVRGCGSMPVIGNVSRRSVGEIWRSPEAEKNRRDMAEGRCPGCYVSCKIEPAFLANPHKTLNVAWNRLTQRT